MSEKESKPKIEENNEQEDDWVARGYKKMTKKILSGETSGVVVFGNYEYRSEWGMWKRRSPPGFRNM